MKTDITVLSEFRDLKDTKVYEVLAEELNERKIRLMNEKDPDVFRVIQGQAQMLFEILNLIDSSEQKIIEMRSKATISMSKAF